MTLGRVNFVGESLQSSQVDNLKTGVLLVNLGTPDEPTAPALRRYLAEFLNDPRVVEAPRLLWNFILHGIILRVRPKKSAALYKTVWTEQGSPLLDISLKQRDKLRNILKERFGDDVIAELGMRYGNPSVSSALLALKQQGVNRLVVLPMFPQYSGATSGSVFDAVADELKKWRWVPELHFISTWHCQESYIQSLTNSVKAQFEKTGKPDKLIFSFHGTPKSYLDKGDPYFYYCQMTAQAVANNLELKETVYKVCFQSRFGREEWLKPYTDETLEELPKQGVRNIAILCPGFVADCLETIEEIGEENREIFMAAGGESYHYIPCVNDDDVFIAAMAQLVSHQLPKEDK